MSDDYEGTIKHLQAENEQLNGYIEGLVDQIHVNDNIYNQELIELRNTMARNLILDNLEYNERHTTDRSEVISWAVESANMFIEELKSCQG